MAKKKSLLNELISATKNKYANIVEDGLDTDIVGYIDSGSYSLNALLSGSIYKGYPSNKVTALAGEESTGKTYFALSAVKYFLENNPEALVFIFESEGAYTSDLLINRGIDPKRTVTLPVATVQEFRYQAIKILDGYMEEDKDTRPPILLILDSLGNLSTEKEMKDTADDDEKKRNTKDMTRAQIVKATFRVIQLRMSKCNVPLILTNHTYQTMGMFSSKVMSGGSGLRYCASIVLFLSKSKDKEGKEVIGSNIKCKTEKSRLTKEQMNVDTSINFNLGLRRYFGLTDLAIEAGVFTKAGKKIALDGPAWEAATTKEDKKKITTRFAKAIDNNPEKYFTKEILDKIDDYCSKKFLYGSYVDNIEAEEEDEEV